MCKQSAKLSTHIAGDEDNHVDQNNMGGVEDESYDFSIVSMHLNSIGFSLTTIFLIVLAVVILKYSSKICLRKCFYVFCPCCVSGLSREREHRKSRQSIVPAITDARFCYPPPGTYTQQVPRNRNSQDVEIQETTFSAYTPAGTLTRPQSTIIQEPKEKPRRQSSEH